MDYKEKSQISLFEELTSQPIPQISQELLKAFDSKQWKKISIAEIAELTPKKLEVIPNAPFAERVMAWPAYYTDMELGIKSGFGELAEILEDKIQAPLIVKVRPEVKRVLDEAQAMLDRDNSTEHLRLVVVDGFRPLEVQRKLFEAYLQYLKTKMPDREEVVLLNKTQKMVSIVPEKEMLKHSPPPHSTGGAVDVILVAKDKIDIADHYWLKRAMINFGAQFDEMMHAVYGDKRSRTNYYEDATEAGEEAMKNRRLLYNLLKKVGFSNNPHEFWHFDFGNQSHALLTGQDSAQYGFAGEIDN